MSPDEIRNAFKERTAVARKLSKLLAESGPLTAEEILVADGDGITSVFRVVGRFANFDVTVAVKAKA